MMKSPEPGRVKTRLVADGLSPDAAADIAREMARCIAHRLAARWPLVLGVSPDGCGEAICRMLDLDAAAVRIVDQGPGDLGERLDRVWRAVGRDTPVAFFGIDSPDVPEAHLDAIVRGLTDHDAAVGPTDDGGYWTLAAGRYVPAVITGIDWGGPAVYDATLKRAAEADVRLFRLPSWGDVDYLDDVELLRKRLRSADAKLDAPLARLARCLESMELPASADE